METILSPLVDTANSQGLATAAATGLSGSRSGEADASASSQGDTVTFSAEGLAKAAAMASNAKTASNAGAGVSAQGQAAGQAGKEEDTEGDATLLALKARVERLQQEIKSMEESELPQKDREAKLASLRIELIEAQTAYYKAKNKTQGSQDSGGSSVPGVA